MVTAKGTKESGVIEVHRSSMFRERLKSKYAFGSAHIKFEVLSLSAVNTQITHSHRGDNAPNEVFFRGRGLRYYNGLWPTKGPQHITDTQY